MKKLLDDDFEEIRVNLFDIKTSEAMKQVADISNRSIMDQLSLDGNDYTQMLKEQREMIVDLTAKTDELKEENRNLKNRLADMENKKS
jgi:ABC-type enterochelin transport system substrate-binding protein